LPNVRGVGIAVFAWALGATIAWDIKRQAKTESMTKVLPLSSSFTN
jgi:hypothetical protein